MKEQKQPDDLADKIEYVRLSQGVTRALAKTLIETGQKLPDDWQEKLPELQRRAAAEVEKLKAAEKTPAENKTK